MEYILSTLYWVVIFIGLEGDYRRSIRRNAQWAKEAYLKDLCIAFWFYVIATGSIYLIMDYYNLEFVQ